MVNKFIDMVKAWAKERGLDKSDPRIQYTKVIEELKELIVNGIYDERKEVIDAIGDLQVTLIVYCLIRGIKYPNTNYEYIIFDDEDNFDEDELRTALIILTAKIGEIIEGYNKQNRHAEVAGIEDALLQLDIISELYGLRKEKCLEEAYKVIANRKGKLIDGVFIKEDDFTSTQGYARGFEDGKNHVFELIKNKFDLGSESDEL